jgi:hypothetical protein
VVGNQALIGKPELIGARWRFASLDIAIAIRETPLRRVP